jgi:hypothetical protein
VILYSSVEMNRQARTAGKRPKLLRALASSGSNDIDRYLMQILVNVGQLLLRNGYGFRRFNKAARLAFVEAALKLDAGSNMPPSIARIAAATGLTRVEVSQLRRTRSESQLNEATSLNRALRVALGWSSDRAFQSSKGMPLQLPFSSAGPNFTRLVKKYSGDIPARAMLAEMERLGIAKENMNGSVELVRESTRTVKPAIAAIRAISPWVNFFRRAGDEGNNEALTSTARQIKIHFDSLPQVYAALRELETRRASFIAGLELLGTRAKRKAEYELTISIAVAAAKPSRAKKAI